MRSERPEEPPEWFNDSARRRVIPGDLVHPDAFGAVATAVGSAGGQEVTGLQEGVVSPMNAAQETVRVWPKLAAVLMIGALAMTGGAGCSRGEGAVCPRIGPPPPGKLYHGIFPGSPTSSREDEMVRGDVTGYQALVEKRVAWVYFSQNWYLGRQFPLATATWIRKTGAVPFIRLMLRSSDDQNVAEPLFTVQAILAGSFDSDLRAWAQAAKGFGTALLVEWGTECNGEWFSWNGSWNGAGDTTEFGDLSKPDGPERFVAAYRHIVATMRAEGADNIAWVFHVNSDDVPEAPWNRLENYYPGDDVVDWLGVSCYGALTPTQAWQPVSLRQQMDAVYTRVAALAPAKPIMLLEFGCTAGHADVQPEQWAQAALTDIFSGRWPRLAGFSWWDERWENDNDRQHDTTMRLQDLPALARVFRQTLSANAGKIQQRPLTLKP